MYSSKVPIENQDLKGLRGSKNVDGVNDQGETWFCDTLQDALGHAEDEGVVRGLSQLKGVDGII